MSNLVIKLDKLPGGFLDEKKLEAGMKPALEAWSAGFVTAIGKGFENQSTPGGGNWKPLSPGYAQRKAKMGGSKMLVLTGKLKSVAINPKKQLGNSGDSGSGQSSNDTKTSLTMTLSVSDPKAATHEFGRGNIPARPFFTVTGQAKDDLRKIVQVALFKAVMG